MLGIELPKSASAHRADDEIRLAVLQRYQLPDAPVGDDFTLLTELAAQLCDVPCAFISVLSADRVWIKSATGMQAEQFPRDQFYCPLAIQAGDSLEIPDLSADPRTATLPLTVQAPGMRMYSGVTLRTADGFALGTLGVLDTRPRALADAQRHMLHRLGRQVMALFEARASARVLHGVQQELQHLSISDALTGLHNRRALLERLTLEVARTKRYRTQLSLVLADMDFFKRINDRHGQAGGDRVLAGIGQMLRDSVRASDIAGRYGGEQFCVILPETGLPGACKFAEIIRLKVAALQSGDMAWAGPLPLTCSLGVAVIDHSTGDAEALLRQADEALHRAKHMGRNRVEC